MGFFCQSRGGRPAAVGGPGEPPSGRRAAALTRSRGKRVFLSEELLAALSLFDEMLNTGLEGVLLLRGVFTWF